MKLTMLAAASALALAGCGGQATRATARLDCPMTEGDLTRVSAAADGKACAYKSSDGAEVSLQLVSVTGDPQATLTGLERQLMAEARNAAPGPDGAASETAAVADSAAAADAARVEAEAHADAGGAPRGGAAGGDRDSEHGRDGVTRVDLPGIHITANETDDTAQVRVGPIHVNASGDDTTVRMFREVRLRGQALSREKRGIRATFIYTGRDLPAGYRYVGYEAGGPKAGPITIAVVRTKTGPESGDDIKHDVEELVRRNGGV